VPLGKALACAPPRRPSREPGCGPVAVCTLTDRELAAALRHNPGVGVAGPLVTANLGIEQVIWAVLERPWIRYLLICGVDSPLFRAGQSLVALVRSGICATDRRIVGAKGYQPFLRSVELSEVTAFRRQIELADQRGESDQGRLRDQISALAAVASGREGPGRLLPGCEGAASSLPAAAYGRRGFALLRPGGRREPVARSGEGFFVISLDHARREVVVEHYRPDLTPGHQMRGVRAESMLLGLLGAGIVACCSHAGYLGAELAKAETALRLGLNYEQDKPLRRLTAAGTARRSRRPAGPQDP
jgi:hypothetical protein